jgi:hypothetical protein
MLLPIPKIAALCHSLSSRAANESKGLRPSFVSPNEEPLGQRFDLLARALAGGLPRRRAFLQLGAFVVADLVGRPLRITLAAAQASACNPTELDQCYEAALRDYDRCGRGCPADPSTCRGTCSVGLTLARQRCDVQFGPCASGTVCCKGTCTNAGKDPRNCGTCGNACASGQVCQNGVCTARSCSLDDLRQCYRRVQTDYYTCAGDCPEGSNPCQDGCFDALARGRHDYCDITFRCPVDTRCCNGYCTNLSRDLQHCGACGKACPIPANSTPTCSNGACGFVCDADFFPCGSSCCEAGKACCSTSCTDLRSDAQNCGKCGHVCPTRPGSTATCKNGMCEPLRG